ncbi:MAG TPA: 5-(carboxyamino)imidazole ribonucleotide mutase [Candidatus Paceibacterota bacterium]|nr:5-(carboxyamino)imidazole ribonucleotide mutase [Candidatus Paceibacterota bacterium]
MKKQNIEVSIIMGSDSDLEIMSEAGKILEKFNVGYEINVVSAHRTPNKLYKNAAEARKKGIKLIIAGAGGSAHLPGMTASMTTIPVIGVPIKTKTMDGLDSLLSIAQMPPGVPVATVGINAGKNAGLLAVQILATSDKNLENKLVAHKKKLSMETEVKGKKLMKIGYKKYLQEKKYK